MTLDEGRYYIYFRCDNLRKSKFTARENSEFFLLLSPPCKRSWEIVMRSPPPNRLGRRHYVFRLSVRLCVRAFILRARAEAFSDGLAVDFF